jgi:hypothetical protein
LKIKEEIVEKDDANEVTQASCIDDKWSSVEEITQQLDVLWKI